MGDGSARRSEQRPRVRRPARDPVRRRGRRALRAGDAAALRELDAGLGADLLAAGVPAWRPRGRARRDRPSAAELLYDDAPYGVGYFVATWTSRA